MGGQPSKTELTAAHEKAVLDRLRDVSIEDDEVESSCASEKTMPGQLFREAEGLPIHVLESWQSVVLSDPKNKYVLLY